jgi:signal transduction histidine kinase
VLWYSAFLAVALVFFVILVWKFTTNGLSASVDSSVRAEARVAELALRHRLTSTAPYWPSGQLSLQVVDTYQEPGVVVIVLDRQGHIRYNSGLSNTSQLPLGTNMIQATLAGQTTWSTVDVGNRRVRVEAVPVRAPAATANGEVTGATATGPVIGTLLIAKSLDEVDTTLLLLRTLLISAGLITLVGTLLGGWAIANRVLQPLAEMAKTARAIAAATAQGTRIGNLSRRVRRLGGRDEMAQVVDTFNEMLTNLEKAIQAQHRFIADASHELRAPLTTVQGNLAFLKRHMKELPAEEQQTMLSDAYGETLRLAQLVEELLLLARADANVDKSPALSGQEKMIDKDDRQQPVELDRTVLQLVRQLRRRASVEASKLKLEVGPIEPVRVRGE